MYYHTHVMNYFNNMYLLLCCLYLSSIYYRSEAVSLTCDDLHVHVHVCPGTKLTCTCNISSTAGLIWRLPGSDTITFDDKAGIGSNGTTTNGIFAAVLTNNTGGRTVSMLIYTATESLMNDTILCVDNQNVQEFASVKITDMFAG